MLSLLSASNLASFISNRGRIVILYSNKMPFRFYYIVDIVFIWVPNANIDLLTFDGFPILYARLIHICAIYNIFLHSSFVIGCYWWNLRHDIITSLIDGTPTYNKFNSSFFNLMLNYLPYELIIHFRSSYLLFFIANFFC